jgi:HEPN domain-containing protein
MPADPSDPHAWITRAYSNLNLAEKGRGKDVMLEDLCFNTQQAAEKALKAVCLFKELDFPKTHSIVRLLDIIESSGVVIPEIVKSGDILTQFAVQTRYPVRWKKSLQKNMKKPCPLHPKYCSGLII